MIPVVAIIGRPNVGKSSLFNRMAKKRKSIVEASGGTTRDRLYVSLSQRGRRFQLVDTGGLDLTDKSKIKRLVRAQTEAAINESNLIIFVCDVTSGIMPLDREITALLRHSSKETILVANKADNQRLTQEAVDFYELGLGKPYPVSCAHNRGIDTLLEAVLQEVKPAVAEKPSPAVKVAIVGRPNVGKSSFLNCLLQEERVIVEEAPGTTRDSIDTIFEKGGTSFLLIDTAGIRHKRKVKEATELYSLSRSKESVRRSDVCIMLVDAEVGLVQDDIRILDYIVKQGKGCLLAVNKWDLIKGIRMEEYAEFIRGRLQAVNFIPCIFTSAVTGRNVLKVLDEAQEVAHRRSQLVPTPTLNRLLRKFEQENPLPVRYGKRPRLYYITQVGKKPPSFLIFTNAPKLIPEAYTKYLENCFRKEVDFTGVPIWIQYQARG